MLRTIIRTLSLWGRSKRPFLTILAVFALAGCQASIPAQQLPELTYGHLQPLNLAVDSIDLAIEYQAPLAAPNVDHLFPITPSEALRRWTEGRLKSVGGKPVARLVVSDASVVETTLAQKDGLGGVFTKDQSERYDARIEATLKVEDAEGTMIGFAKTDIKRSITIREDANINDRELAWFKLIEALMKDFNVEMEKNIRQHLGDWLT